MLNAILGLENKTMVRRHLLSSSEAGCGALCFLTFNLTHSHLYASFAPFADVILGVVVGQDPII